MLRLAATFLLLSITACGFQLRGAYPLPESMEQTWVQYGGSDTAIRRETVRALNLNDVRVASSMASATAVLDIQQATTRREILSRDRQGRPQEYNLSIDIRFRLLDADGAELLEPQEVSAATVLALDTTNPTATQSEVEAATTSLRETAVMQMIRALSAVGDNVPSENTAPDSDQ